MLKQSIAFQQLLQYDEYQALLQRYEPAAQQLRDPALLGRFCATLGQIDWYHGRLNEARELATRALQFSQAAGDFTGIAHASRIVQWSHYYKGELQHAIEWGDRALAALEQTPSEVEFIWSVCGKSWAYHWQGHWELAVSEIHRALPVAETTSHLQFGAFVLWTLAASLIDQGRFEEGLEYALRALEKGPTPEGRLIAQTYVGWAHARAGRHDQALALLQPLVRGYRTGGFLFRELLVRLYIAESLLLRGEPAEAGTMLDGVLELAQGGEMKGIVVRASRLLGEIASHLAPTPEVAWGEAAGYFEKGIALARQIGTENTLAQCCFGYGRLHARCGHVGQARACFTEALEIFERLGTLMEPDQVRATLARLPKG